MREGCQTMRGQVHVVTYVTKVAVVRKVDDITQLLHNQHVVVT